MSTTSNNAGVTTLWVRDKEPAVPVGPPNLTLALVPVEGEGTGLADKQHGVEAKEEQPEAEGA
jgi:hypothetical protein